MYDIIFGQRIAISYFMLPSESDDQIEKIHNGTGALSNHTHVESKIGTIRRVETFGGVQLVIDEILNEKMDLI